MDMNIDQSYLHATVTGSVLSGKAYGPMGAHPFPAISSIAQLNPPFLGPIAQIIFYLLGSINLLQHSSFFHRKINFYRLSQTLTELSTRFFGLCACAFELVGPLLLSFSCSFWILNFVILPSHFRTLELLFFALGRSRSYF
jgi:hypothetical protein